MMKKEENHSVKEGEEISKAEEIIITKQESILDEGKGSSLNISDCHESESTMREDGDEIDKQKPPNKECTCFDVVFALDCTESMKPYMKSAKDVIRVITDELTSSNGRKTESEFALIQYRDHKPNDRTFVTKVHELTTPKRIKSLLYSCQPAGGGDMPEAVADALHDMLYINWRRHTAKVGILVADAPPHGLMDKEDRFPKGCPEGIDPFTVAEEMAERGITLHVIGCEPSVLPFKKFYQTISSCTGGTYTSLAEAKRLASLILRGDKPISNIAINGHSIPDIAQTKCTNTLPDVCQTSVTTKTSFRSTFAERKVQFAPASLLHQTFANEGYELSDHDLLFTFDKI